MCWKCDHPDGTVREYLDHLHTIITTYGWAVQGVERDRLRPPWAYTIGLTALGHPELVVTGLSHRKATEFLNQVARHVVHHGGDLVPGEQHTLGGGQLIEIVELAEPSAHLIMAVELYGSQLRAFQLVRADDRGRWPWEPGHRSGRGGQPVLGPRSAGGSFRATPA